MNCHIIEIRQGIDFWIVEWNNIGGYPLIHRLDWQLTSNETIKQAGQGAWRIIPPDFVLTSLGKCSWQSSYNQQLHFKSNPSLKFSLQNTSEYFLRYAKLLLKKAKSKSSTSLGTRKQELIPQEAQRIRAELLQSRCYALAL